jgi:hypothetical protein
MGDEAIARIPNAAQRVDHWLAERPLYADENARTMPWLPERDEAEVKRLLNHDLPLASSNMPVGSRWKRAAYRWLRARAQRNLADGVRSLPVDRWLYERLFGVRLNRTYVA